MDFMTIGGKNILLRDCLLTGSPMIRTLWRRWRRLCLGGWRETCETDRKRWTYKLAHRLDVEGGVWREDGVDMRHGWNHGGFSLLTARFSSDTRDGQFFPASRPTWVMLDCSWP